MPTPIVSMSILSGMGFTPAEHIVMVRSHMHKCHQSIAVAKYLLREGRCNEAYGAIERATWNLARSADSASSGGQNYTRSQREAHKALSILAEKFLRDCVGHR